MFMGSQLGFRNTRNRINSLTVPYGVTAPSAVPEYIGAHQSSENSFSYTFLNVPIGAASADRRVILGFHASGINQPLYVVYVRVNGVEAAEDVQSKTSEGTRENKTHACAIYSALVPTGTTANIEIFWSLAVQRCEMHVLAGRNLDTVNGSLISSAVEVVGTSASNSLYLPTVYDCITVCMAGIIGTSTLSISGVTQAATSSIDGQRSTFAAQRLAINDDNSPKGISATAAVSSPLALVSTCYRGNRYTDTFFDPTALPFNPVTYLTTRSQGDLKRLDSPYVLSAVKGEVTYRWYINDYFGGTVHAQVLIIPSLGINDEFGGEGGGKGVLNISNRDGQGEYNPTAAGLNKYEGVQASVTIAGNGDIVVAKARMPFFQHTEKPGSGESGTDPAWLEKHPSDDFTYYELGNDPGAVVDQYTNLPIGSDPTGNPYADGGAGFNKVFDFVEHGTLAAALAEKNAAGFTTQRDEVTSEFDAGIRYRNLTPLAGLPCINIKWFQAYAQSPKGLRQFRLNSTQLGQMFSMYRGDRPHIYDRTAFAVDGAWRTNDSPNLQYRYYGLDELDVNGDVKMFLAVDQSEEGQGNRTPTYFRCWEDLVDPNWLKLITSTTGRVMLQDDRDPLNEQYKNNGTGGAGSIWLTIASPSADPNDRRAIGLYHPRSIEALFPLVGFDSTPGVSGSRIRYQINNRVSATTWPFLDGEEGVAGEKTLFIRSPQLFAGIFRPNIPAGQTRFPNIVELYRFNRIMLQGTPNEIHECAWDLESMYARNRYI